MIKFKLPEGFDPAAYLALNPDVERSGRSPRLHYLLRGHAEGRRFTYTVDDEIASEIPAPASTTSPPPKDFPAIEKHHLHDAKLYAARHEMIFDLKIPVDSTIAEVGVGHGDFSQFLIDHMRPAKFVAFDLWNLHELPELWGHATSVLFDNKTQQQFFLSRFASSVSRIIVETGPSYERLATYPDETFDLIYLDAGHDYDSVKKDAAVSIRKVKNNGVLIFNDYIMSDSGGDYGVVQAVNELVAIGEWKIVGFSLQKHMFCDIALKRIPAPSPAHRDGLG